MPKKKDISILDVTIRDGSYAINYQYTPAQVAAIVSELDAAGIEYIEVSHGCGLGAGENIGIEAAASDADYVNAAKKSSRSAKIGVIAGPYPTTQFKDIDSIINDVDFIRFAANCNDPGIIQTNINYALKKRPDIALFLQLMRSSRCPLQTIVKAGRQAESMGAEMIYLVDTAGFYDPHEVSDIVAALVAKLKIQIGFHGHNNLGLAVANSIAAVEAGASAVDASLKGIGRASGNAQLEALIALLKRRGLARKIDLEALIIAGEKHIAPIMPPQYGLGALDLLTARANIDLYPVALYNMIAKEADISLGDLIITLVKDRRLVEAGPDEVFRALKKMGVDPLPVFESLGIAVKKPAL